jgi:hypothetical protein
MRGSSLLCLASLAYLTSAFRLNAQDQLFLRNEHQVIECYIIQADDSLIIFRSSDLADSVLYEISVRETYGFLLEEPLGKEGGIKSAGLQLRVFHPKKKRSHLYYENSGIIFRLIHDSSFVARRGKITRIFQDSLEIETKVNKRRDRYFFALSDVVMFGYTTSLTEMLSIIVFPFPTGKSEADFFYRNMHTSHGWRYQILSSSTRKMKKSGKRKKIRLGGAIRRKAGLLGKY